MESEAFERQISKQLDQDTRIPPNSSTMAENLGGGNVDAQGVSRDSLEKGLADNLVSKKQVDEVDDDLAGKGGKPARKLQNEKD
jgi:hypothetical protein